MSSWHNTVCPHDCPSACALQVEKIAPDQIGRVRGSPHQPYTDGIICAKVSRYKERIHDPARILEPMIRTSKKNQPAKFEAISWDVALDRLADEFNKASEQFGPESVWPYYYGGTMGLLQRDGILKLSHAKGYSGM